MGIARLGLSQRILRAIPRPGTHPMLRFDPGTITPDSLTHPFSAEAWIVSGSVIDLRPDTRRHQHMA